MQVGRAASWSPQTLSFQDFENFKVMGNEDICMVQDIMNVSILKCSRFLVVIILKGLGNEDMFGIVMYGIVVRGCS